MLPALEAGDFMELTPLYLKAQHMRTLPTINMRYRGTFFHPLCIRGLNEYQYRIFYIYIYIYI